MKYLLLVLASVLGTESAFADDRLSSLAAADSLFHRKQYTQSLEIYNQLFSQHTYSPSMLLKMAYIEEGLGHVAQSVYYLSLYYQATSDSQAIAKINEVADKNKLAGYDDSDTSRLWYSIRENYRIIAFILMSVCSLLFATVYYQKVRMNARPVGAGITLLFFLAVLALHAWIGNAGGRAIIAAPSTYFMSGPSSGSRVVSIVGAGHRVDILGHTDVWVKVRWNDREAYVLQSDLLLL